MNRWWRKKNNKTNIHKYFIEGILIPHPLLFWRKFIKNWKNFWFKQKSFIEFSISNRVAAGRANICARSNNKRRNGKRRQQNFSLSVAIFYWKIERNIERTLMKVYPWRVFLLCLPVCLPPPYPSARKWNRRRWMGEQTIKAAIFHLKYCRGEHWNYCCEGCIFPMRKCWGRRGWGQESGNIS